MDISSIAIVAIVVGAGWMFWRRRQRGLAATAAAAQAGAPSTNLAHEAFVRGNTRLMEGKFAEAITAFKQTLELEPKHPHVAGRIIEVERQQLVANAVAPA